ncbi:MAG: hypothetical protein ABFC94_09320 [Syntrophomonas sp.]
MRKLKKLIGTVTLTIILTFILNAATFAVTWEYGTSGTGKNPFTPRGYVIVTDTGKYWLNSRFDNSTGTVTYSGVQNGLSYIDAKKIDGSKYTLYAFTDRTPQIYKYLTAYKNGKPIPNFSSYAGSPGRLNVETDMGSGADWSIPINGFEFEPGCYYEFAFQRGLQAKNGITLVFSQDGKGYIQNPETAEEKVKYEHDKYFEYQFMSSYWVLKDPQTGDYKYDFHLVPMRFSVQTYSDLTTWENGKQEAQQFINSITPKDISNGKYNNENINELQLTMQSLEKEAQTSIKKQLQPAAEENMQLMLLELKIALKKAQNPESSAVNLNKLHALLNEAKDLYQTAAANIGTDMGQYGKTETLALKESIDSASALNEKDGQSVINEAFNNLQEAMDRVYASKVREDSIILFDRASGVKAVIPRGAVPDDVVMYVKTLSDTDDAYRKLQRAFGQDTKIAIYDIKLYNHDLIVQPTGKIELQIPIIGGAKSGTSHVYTVSDDLTTSQIISAEAEGYKIFSVNRTGMFIEAASGTRLQPPKNTENKATVEETNTDVNEKPDANREELDETKGPKDVVEDTKAAAPRVKQETLAPISIPLDKVKRSAGSPIYIVLIAALLAAAATVMAGYSIFLRLKKRVK